MMFLRNIVGCVWAGFRVMRPLLSAVTYPVFRGGPHFVLIETNWLCSCLVGSREEALHQPAVLPTAPLRSSRQHVWCRALLSALWGREASFPVILWPSSGEGVRWGRMGAGFASRLQHQPASAGGQR